jgi:phage terminase large subunit
LWVNVGREAERDPDRFERLRDEIWWDLRDGLELGKVQLMNDEDMLGQMTSIKYEQYRGSLSKMKVESKREMKARGLKSPDTADAVVLWNYARLKRGRVTRRSHQSLRLSHLRRRLDWRTV